jgi:hypothetical protein
LDQQKTKTSVTIVSRNDELSSTMSWVGCLLKDSELFILFVWNIQIHLKISVIPILLTFSYLVTLNLLLNNQLNSSLQHIIVTLCVSSTKQKYKTGVHCFYCCHTPISFFKLWKLLCENSKQKTSQNN